MGISVLSKNCQALFISSKHARNNNRINKISSGNILYLLNVRMTKWIEISTELNCTIGWNVHSKLSENVKEMECKGTIRVYLIRRIFRVREKSELGWKLGRDRGRTWPTGLSSSHQSCNLVSTFVDIAE